MERTKVNEYYDNPLQFKEEVFSINVRKLTNISDKDLIRKLRRWIKEYWVDDGSMFLYETQYARLQNILKSNID